MRGMYGNEFRGWRGGGFFFPPFLMLLAAFLVLFLIIQSGLWLPLLLIGVGFWLFSPMRRRGWHGGFNRLNRFHDSGTRHFYANPAPKRGDEIEYV